MDSAGAEFLESYLREKKMILKCGHAPNSICGNPPVPACVICDCVEVEPVDENSDLTGRVARCIYHGKCGTEVPSDPSLPFFKKGDEHDTYYCGCKGWD